MLIYAVDQPALPPYTMPQRFRHEIAYFMTPGGTEGIPHLPSGEYWIRLSDARECLDEGVVRIVSPLDTASKAEIELSEEQEAWLEWVVRNGVRRVRLQ